MLISVMLIKKKHVMQIRVAGKMINVKNATENITLVFALLVKIRNNPDLIIWLILLQTVWKRTKPTFLFKLLT